MQENQIFEEPANDVLEREWLHQVMVAFHLPVSWPTWTIAGAAVLLTVVAGIAWWVSPEARQSAWLVMVMLWLFMLADVGLLLSLPRRQLSFGPWKAQFFTLAVPRVLATAGIGVITGATGWEMGPAAVLIVQIAGTISLYWAAVIEPFRLALTHYELRSDRLPAGSTPIRLLHISDLHVERLTQREEDVLSLIAQAAPDLILITGDYVNLSYHRDPVTLAQVKQLLGQMSAPYGVFATLGSPPVDLRETVVPLFEDIPVVLMREQWTTVNLADGRSLVLMGMDCTHHLPTDRARLERLAGAAPNGDPQILLYHSPELMPEASQLGIDLYLCGHTHGGQVRLPLVGPLITSSQLGRQFVMGPYVEGRTHLYVSRGIGLEGLSAPRVRFLSPPEMTLITLLPA